MDVVEQYSALMEGKRWEDALPLVELSVKMDPQTPTGWHDYGACLAGLGRYKEANQYFLKAYELNSEDLGYLYAVFRNYYVQDDTKRFFELAKRECAVHADVIDLLISDEYFSEYFALPEFQDLAALYDR
jgi:tetratricopeptide (TPR) repeat protein